MVWHRQLRRRGALLVILGALAACSGSSAPPPPSPTAAGATPAAVGGTVDPAANGIEGYRLASGDQIRLTVFRHPDLSGEFQVDGLGNLSLPLIGQVNVDGATVEEAEDRIREKLMQGYLVDPQISMEVLNYRPFYILGEVQNPGSYPYVNGMTVLNGVALAGGFSYRASEGRITVTRGGSNGRQFRADVTTQILPGDIITVPERFF
jgi:protein involved in polysaccharide export with SLBB domain